MAGVRCAVMLMSLASSATYAQHPIVLHRLQAANAASPQPSADVVTAEVMKAAAKSHQAAGGCLPQGTVVDHVAPATGVPLVFGSIVRKQVQNAWTVVARHPDCGTDIVRYMIIKQGDGSLYTFRLNRGRSFASETLIGDTLRLATLQAIVTVKRAGLPCDFDVKNFGGLGVTRIALEEPGLGPDIYGVRYTGSWQEIWPITLCGRTTEMTIRFTADGDSGAYIDIKGATAHLLPVK